MSLVLQSKIISLSSKDGLPVNNISSSYLSHLFFPFKSILQDEKDIVYSTISIQSVEMANSFYNINNANNKIDVKITITASGDETTSQVIIPNGNYSASSFITQFNLSFVSATGYTGLLTLNNNNGVYSLTPNANTYTITLLSTSSILSVLGITQGTNPVFTFGANDNSFSFACNFLGVTRLKIFSEALTCANIDSNGLSQNSMIDIISVSAPSYGLITYDTNNQESQIKNKNIDGIDIRITDGDNNLVNFNFINWTMTFLLNTYRVVDVNELKNSKDFSDYLAKTNLKENIKDKEEEKSKDEKTKPKKDPPIDKELELLLS